MRVTVFGSPALGRWLLPPLVGPQIVLDRFDPFSTALDPCAEPPDELQTKINDP